MGYHVMSREIDRSAEWRSQRNVSWMWWFLVTTVGLCRFTPPRSIMRRPIACSFVDMGKGIVVNGFCGDDEKGGWFILGEEAVGTNGARTGAVVSARLTSGVAPLALIGYTSCALFLELPPSRPHWRAPCLRIAFIDSSSTCSCDHASADSLPPSILPW